MRKSPETFRSRALECLRLAQDAGDSHHESLLLGMAETWSILAQSAEAMESYVDAREALRAH
jgi:hypothetical protein